MEILLAANSGFCFGVKRAIRIAFDSADKDKRIITMGPLIHNPQMVKKLEEKGIFTVECIDDIGKNDTVIIRSHGIPKEKRIKLEKIGCKLIDATCPKVKKAQKWVEKLSEEEYEILIAGDRTHPEVIGLYSFRKGNAYCAQSIEEIPDKKFNKLGVVAQTTFNEDLLKDIVSGLVKKTNELRLINTVCDATSIRQNSTLNLAEKCDLLIVIGGKNSSNTKMLAKISKPFVKVHHIEESDEIREDWFKDKKTIGLTAGASTPDWIIIGIYKKVQEITNYSGKEITNVGEIPTI